MSSVSHSEAFPPAGSPALLHVVPDEQPDPLRAVGNTLAEDSLREFYDPTGSHAHDTTRKFLWRAANTRRASMVVGAKRLVGHEVILAESTHALLDGGTGITLPIDRVRQHEIIDATQTYARAVADAVGEVASEIENEHAAKRKVSPDIPSLPSHLVLSGKVLAAVAHEGVKRRTNRDYFAHPDEVASITSIAWRQHMGWEHEDSLDIMRFLAYGHDAFEDIIDPRSSYLGARHVVTSPLVARYILEDNGLPAEEARDIARTLLWMTRTKDTQARKMPYPMYIERGILRGGSRFIIAKAADVRHNGTIEPPPFVPGQESPEDEAKRHNKHRTYEQAADRLKQAAVEVGDTVVANIVSTIFSTSHQDVQDVHHTKYPLNLPQIAQSVRQKVPRPQAA